MHIDIYLVMGSAVVGLLVGLTGMGGGALMTPMLVLLFGVTPSAAIASDLMAAFFMKPAGVFIHWRRKTVNGAVVRYLCYGSVPAAFFGTYVTHLLGQSVVAEHRLEIMLGSALIIGAIAIFYRSVFVETPAAGDEHVKVRPVPTVFIGVVGGFMVGLTSVGAGSLILVLLVMVYPTLSNKQLVGTDLAQSLPLTFSAAFGTLLFGHVELGLTSSIVIGSVPMVIVGSLLSSRSNGYLLRRIITGVVLLSGLKYVGVPDRLAGHHRRARDRPHRVAHDSALAPHARPIANLSTRNGRGCRHASASRARRRPSAPENSPRGVGGARRYRRPFSNAPPFPITIPFCDSRSTSISTVMCGHSNSVTRVWIECGSSCLVLRTSCSRTSSATHIASGTSETSSSGNEERRLRHGLAHVGDQFRGALRRSWPTPGSTRPARPRRRGPTPRRSPPRPGSRRRVARRPSRDRTCPSCSPRRTAAARYDRAHCATSSPARCGRPVR